MLAVPKDFVDLYEVTGGDVASFEPLGERSFRIKGMRRSGKDSEHGLDLLGMDDSIP